MMCCGAATLPGVAACARAQVRWGAATTRRPHAAAARRARLLLGSAREGLGELAPAGCRSAWQQRPWRLLRKQGLRARCCLRQRARAGSLLLGRPTLSAAACEGARCWTAAPCTASLSSCSFGGGMLATRLEFLPSRALHAHARTRTCRAARAFARAGGHGEVSI